MQIILPLVLGIFLSAAGVVLPGLINMTAAKISLMEGRRRAVVFALGASTVVFFQTYIAVTFAKFIDGRPDIVNVLEEIGLFIFSALTVFFLFFAKTKDFKNEQLKKESSYAGNFFLGALLSALNFFPIPYYVFISVSLAASGTFHFESLFIFLFVMGVVLGSFGIFYLYIAFFKRFEHKADFFMKNVNYFLGSVTGVVSIITLIKMFRNH